MCRYSMSKYKGHSVCFKCPASFKLARIGEVDGAKQVEMKRAVNEEGYLNRSGRLCPNCRGEMYYVGRDFRAPRKQDKRSWRALETLVKAGIIFNSCGCDGPGWRPESPRVAAEYVTLIRYLNDRQLMPTRPTNDWAKHQFKTILRTDFHLI